MAGSANREATSNVRRLRSSGSSLRAARAAGPERTQRRLARYRSGPTDAITPQGRLRLDRARLKGGEVAGGRLVTTLSFHGAAINRPLEMDRDFKKAIAST